MTSKSLRIANRNPWCRQGNWWERRKVLVELSGAAADLIAFQEAITNDEYDQTVISSAMKFQDIHDRGTPHLQSDMTIQPDTKDWTWVLSGPCQECHFDASMFDSRAVAAALRANTREWRSLLDHPRAAVRPAPDRWSALEYGCHVRDVFKLYRERLLRMLDEEDPLFQNWDQDKASIEDHYDEQHPKRVAVELEEVGAGLADAFDSVPDAGWSRTGRRSDGASFTIDTFSRYLLHDPIHHLVDVTHGFTTLDSATGSQ